MTQTIDYEILCMIEATGLLNKPKDGQYTFFVKGGKIHDRGFVSLENMQIIKTLSGNKLGRRKTDKYL